MRFINQKSKKGMRRGITLIVLCIVSTALFAAAPEHHHVAHHPSHHVAHSTHHHFTHYPTRHAIHHPVHHLTHHATRYPSKHFAYLHAHHCWHHAQHQLAPHQLALLKHDQTFVDQTAERQLGKPYIWGAENPNEGFDCSGFSQYVYRKEGVHIPRTAEQQYASLKPVHRLQNGDLVFFRTEGRGVSHVGIYLGQGYFIHAPERGEDIRVDRLNTPYWEERYAGARRVLSSLNA